jgi:hypothetical protein
VNSFSPYFSKSNAKDWKIMAIETTRKCKECKDLIVLEEGEFVVQKISQKEVYFHFECFVKNLVEKKKGGMEEGEARKVAEGLKVESREAVRDIIARNHLFGWLQRKYDIVVLPSYIFTKFDAIFKGEYKGQSKAIPAEDILDMFERKWEDLCKTYAWNTSKGNSMDALGRLNYDIAIILSKSTSYYKWKQENKATQQKLKEIQLENTNKIKYENIVSKPNNKQYVAVDINNIIDEI